jgi:hypothetical protein
MPTNPFDPPKEVKPGRVDLRPVFQFAFWLVVAALVVTWIVLPLFLLVSGESPRT